MKKILFLLAVLLVGASAGAQSVQQSGNITPGHVACWAITGVIYDCGTSGGSSIVGPFTANDLVAVNGSGSLIDSGINPLITSNWTGQLNLNGGATAPTRARGDNTTNVATTAFVQAASSTSVLTCGADPTGVADSAPAFRACVASNRVLLIPPGTYNFCSTVPVPEYISAFLNPAVLVQSLSNFAISGYGATINVCSAISASTAFQFDQDTNFEVFGLTINPDPTSGTSTGLSFSNTVNFIISDITLGPGLNNQAVYGDWLVNGVFEHFHQTTGSCFDMAFLKNIKFDDVTANVTTPPASGTCWDAINDPINAGINRTGFSYTQNDGVTVTRFNVSGYATGALLLAGKNFYFSGNHWHDNPGVSPSTPGIAILIGYFNGGSFTSAGFPVNHVIIDGDTFSNNGGTVAGQAIRIDPASIANSDEIGSISINNSIFHNNAAIGINLTTASHTDGNFILGQGNSFSTAGAQTSNVNTIMYTALGTPQSPFLFTFGSPPTVINLVGATPTTGNAIALGNNNGIVSENFAGNGLLSLLFADVSNNIHIGLNVGSGAAPVIFGSTISLPGSSTGAVTLNTANAGASNFILTLPAITDTIVALTATQTLTNKTIAFSSNTLTGVAPLASPTFTGLTTFSGQFITTFGTPTIASGACGATTNGAVTGVNQSGLVTIGSATTTTCTVSFSTTITAPNSCVIFPANAAAAAQGTTVARVSSVGTTNFVITGSALANSNYYYLCI